MYYQGPAFHGDKGMLSKNVIQPSAPTDATLPLRRMLNKAVDHYAPKPPKDARAHWWIVSSNSPDGSDPSLEVYFDDPGCGIKVIEYAAYEKLERSVEREMRLTDRSNARIADLERELAEAKAANGKLKEQINAAVDQYDKEHTKSAALIEALKEIGDSGYPSNLNSPEQLRANVDRLVNAARAALAKWGKG